MPQVRDHPSYQSIGRPDPHVELAASRLDVPRNWQKHSEFPDGRLVTHTVTPQASRGKVDTSFPQSDAKNKELEQARAS